MKFVDELKRRNVFRVGLVYLVASWLLIQIADTVFPRIDLPDWSVTLIIALLAVGFIPALLLAWAFELSPEGLRRESHARAESTGAAGGRGGRGMNYTIIGLLLVAVAYFLWERQQPRPSEPGRSIAVLPFVDLSEKSDQEYFGDGIAEEILNVLARTEGLAVASRTSSFQFKGRQVDLTEVGETLGVANVLEGSIRKGSGGRIRITAQLIDAANGFHLWSATYDRELTDIFAIQDEISVSIVSAMLGELGIDALPKNRFAVTDDLEVYDLYLRASDIRRTRTDESLNESARLLREALALDEGFGPAWSALGKAHMLLATFGHQPAAGQLDTATAALSRALSIDPSDAAAMAALAQVSATRLELAQAGPLFRRSLDLAPNQADTHYWFGLYLAQIGEPAESLQHLLRAWELDPGISSLPRWLAQLHTIEGNREEAARLIALLPDAGSGPPLEVDSIPVGDYILEKGRDFFAVMLNLTQGDIEQATQAAARASQTIMSRFFLSIEIGLWSARPGSYAAGDIDFTPLLPAVPGIVRANRMLGRELLPETGAPPSP
ncbi:MAG: hypothetical protein ABFS14_11615 [Gemmatimonadota bacterium]